LIKLSDFTDMFPWIRMPEDDPEPPPRYNIAPTQPIPVVTNVVSKDGKNQVELFRWGLVPPWAKDVSIGNRMINARVESLADKGAFKHAFRRRRCLIPANGFYEWPMRADGKSKQAMYIRMKSHKPFAFAGLWEVWRDENGNELPSCTIITGAPNDLVKPLHDRMPAILREENYRKWLDPKERSPDELMPLLKPYPDEQMEAYPVGKLVNSPANESAECIERQAEAPPEPAPAEPVLAQELRSRKKGRKKADDSPTLFG
jgi:putative SOS response-associated peptidase YedK